MTDDKSIIRIGAPLALISLLMSLLVTSGWALGPIPDGHYGGSGEVNANCRDTKGELLTYREEIVIQGNTLTSIAHFGGGRPDQIDTKKFTFSSQGFFTYTAEPNGKGDGYCGNLACHWSGEHDGIKGEDTISFDSRGLWVLGSAVLGGEVWVCETRYDQKL